MILPAVMIIALFRVHNSLKSRIDNERGIQESTYVIIGGIEQYLQIRGEDKDNPVILWLHGGPGFPLTYLTYYYQPGLEKDYTTACWEQRGCGKTYYKNKDNGNITMERLLADTDEVVDYLRKRFGKDKIILIGQSWGTVLGMEYLNIHPEKLSEYLGIGQVTDFLQGKIHAAEEAARIAASKGYRNDAEYLERSAELLSRTRNIEKLDIDSLERMVTTSAKYLKHKGEMSGIKQMFTALTSPQMLWNDVKWFLFASRTQNILASQKNLVNHMYFQFDVKNLNRSYNIPICFIQGDNDWITPTDLVSDYYETITAVNKEMIIISDAGHTPFLDNPKRFCDAVKAFLSYYKPAGKDVNVSLRQT